eukprot:1781322-Rhodomonas_salina.1
MCIRDSPLPLSSLSSSLTACVSSTSTPRPLPVSRTLCQYWTPHSKRVGRYAAKSNTSNHLRSTLCTRHVDVCISFRSAGAYLAVVSPPLPPSPPTLLPGDLCQYRTSHREGRAHRAELVPRVSVGHYIVNA